MRTPRTWLWILGLSLLTALAPLATRRSATFADAPATTSIAAGIVRETLPNGLKVVVKEMHACPVVTTLMAYHVGSADEVKGKTGLSHYLEHMMFKGTDKYRKGEIDLITMKNGGANNAFTQEDITAYHFDFASDRWQTALTIEANRMRNCTFDVKEVDAERNVVIEEMKADLDTPMGTLAIRLDEAMWTAHPYRHPIIGYEADLKTEGRDEFYAHYNKYYVPNNAALIVVGDVKAADVFAQAKVLFGPIPKGADIARSVVVEPQQVSERRISLHEGATADRLKIGFHTCKIGEPDDYVLDIVSAVLTGGKTSRLHQKLVEDGKLATRVDSSNDVRQYPGAFYLEAEAHPGRVPADVEKAILDELARLASEPISERELARAKNGIEANYLFSKETTNALASELAMHESLGTTDYLERYLDRVRAVTREQVTTAARKYFTPENRTVAWSLQGEADEDGDAKGDAKAGTEKGQEGGAAAPPDGGKHRRPARSGSTAALKFVGRAAHRGFPAGPAWGPAPGPNPAPAAPPQPAAPPASARAPIAFRLGDVKRTVLDNGLVLLLRPNRDLPLVSVAAHVDAVALYEPEDKAGLATLVGNCLMEGTRTRKGKEIADAIEFVGGALATGATGATVKVLSRDTDLALDLLADVLQNPAFETEVVEKERDKILVTLKTQEDEPETAAQKLFDEMVYAGHPAHRPSLGDEKTVKAITRDDVLKYYDTYFRPNNTVLAVSGDFDPARMAQALTARFKGWEKKPVERPKMPPLERAKTGRTKFVNMETQQAIVMMGHLGIRRNCPDFAALRVLDYVLGTGTGFTDRMSKRVRDELGLAYTVHANITDSAGIEPGAFVALMGTQAKNVKKGMEEMRKVIQGVLDTPPTEEEVANAKDYLTGNFVFSFETNDMVVQHLIEVERYGLGLDYFTKYPKEIAAVTAADVKRVAAQYLDPKALFQVAIGAIDDEDGEAVEGGAKGKEDDGEGEAEKDGSGKK